MNLRTVGIIAGCALSVIGITLVTNKVLDSEWVNGETVEVKEDTPESSTAETAEAANDKDVTSKA